MKISGIQQYNNQNKFEIKNKMTKHQQDEIHYRLPSLKHACRGKNVHAATK